MTIKLHKVLFLAVIGASMVAAGCELAVDFDRTLIPVETLDSGTLIDAASLGDGSNNRQDGSNNNPETSTPTEAGTDSGTQDSGTQDSGIQDSGIQDAKADG